MDGLMIYILFNNISIYQDDERMAMEGVHSGTLLMTKKIHAAEGFELRVVIKFCFGSGRSRKETIDSFLESHQTSSTPTDGSLLGFTSKTGMFS